MQREEKGRNKRGNMETERKQAEIETAVEGVLMEAGLLTTQRGDGCAGSYRNGRWI